MIRDPEHAGKRHVWEPGDPAFVCEAGFADRGTKPEGHTVPMNGRGKSDSPIVPEKLSNKARTGLRRGWREGGWLRGTCERTACSGHRAGQIRNPDSSGYARPSAYASSPEAGAGCGSSARPDLCGGRLARAVPTATTSCI